jgi:hypothetical protein
MKKFFTILAFVSALAIGLSSCTEEEVKPNTGDNAGGAGSAKGF